MIVCKNCKEGIKEGPGFLRTVCKACKGLGFIQFTNQQLEALATLATVQLAKEYKQHD